MFRSALLRLTFLYLGLTMLVSLFFSALLYRTLTRELDASIHRQELLLRRIPLGFGFTAPPNEVTQLLEAEIDTGHRHILAQLVEDNLIILVLAGATSYLLARHTLEPLEEAHELQSRFASDASHELRTPLTVMKAEIEVALRDRSPDVKKLQGLLGSTLEEIGKLEGLTGGLLSLARNQGKLDSRLLEPCRFDEAVREALATARPLAAAREIILDDAGLAEARVLGDGQSLAELALILLDNAIKYTPEKGRVSVAVREKGRQATLTVADQGIGIDPAQLPHVFDRFWRADQARSRDGAGKSGGYGLGLPIAKAIVAAHDGSIEIQSVVGKGTKVTVGLPVIVQERKLPRHRAVVAEAVDHFHLADSVARG